MNHMDLHRKIEALKKQVSTLEKNCKTREEKLTELLMMLAPFINSLGPEAQKQIEDNINRD